METFIIIIIAITTLLVFIPTTFLLVMWLKSYNRIGIIYQEIGDNPNHAHRTKKKFKVKNERGLGQYIHFLFGMLPDSKSFSSTNWYYIKEGKKTLMGVPLYLQRDNYRPLTLKKDPFRLVPDSVDSREFKLRRFIHRAAEYENNRIYLFAIGFFLLFMVVLGVSYALSNYYLSTEVAKAVMTNTPSPISVG